MVCPKCGGEMTMSVSIRLKMPAKYAHLITKGAIREKECQIMAAFWEGARVVCDTCGFHMKGI